MEIAPHVHWLETGSSNVYLLTPPRITADKTAARHSGIRLLQLSPAVIACGHGTPSTRHTADELMHVFNTLRQE
jgi:hypothetical protein